MATFVFSLTVSHDLDRFKATMENENRDWAITESVVKAVTELIDGSEFPLPVAGGPACWVQADGQYVIDVPIEFDNDSQGLRDLLFIGRDESEPLESFVNQSLADALLLSGVEVDVLVRPPA